MSKKLVDFLKKQIIWLSSNMNKSIIYLDYINEIDGVFKSPTGLFTSSK